MKNIQLIAFLFGLGLIPGAAQGIFAQSFDFSKEEFTISSKVNLPFLEIRGAVKPSLDWNYGLSFSSKKLTPKVPVTIKIGNLYGGGSLSKLNSPALYSSLSPFTSSSVKAGGLDVSLPQYNNFSYPQSYYFDIAIKPEIFVKQINFGLFYKDNKDSGSSITTSAGVKIAPGKKIDLSYYFTGGLYPYKKNGFTTWFSQERFYKEGKHLCFNNQLSFSAGGFSSLLIASTYQSPFGDFLNTWRVENVLKLKHFTFNLNCFYNPNEKVITSSDKKLKPLLQINGGGQYKCITGTKKPVSVILGINTLGEVNLLEKTHSLKNTAGIQYSGSVFSGKIATDINFKLTEETEGIKAIFSDGAIEASNSFYFNNLTSALTGKFTFTPDAKKTKWTFTEKAGISFEYENSGGNISFTNKNQISFTQKTGESKNKISFTSTLSVKFQFRFCSLHVHLEFQE